MPQQLTQVFGPVLILKGLPRYTRDALSRALASWQEARRRAFGPSTLAADLPEVHAAREALEEALWILGPVALPGSSPFSNRTFLHSIFCPGDRLLLRHSWALDQALHASQEAQWNL